VQKSAGKTASGRIGLRDQRRSKRDRDYSSVFKLDRIEIEEVDGAESVFN
jgi:hypothetical protein